MLCEVCGMSYPVCGAGFPVQGMRQRKNKVHAMHAV